MLPRISNFALMLGCSLLVGCASKQLNEDTTIVDDLILESADQIQKTQADLYQAAAINRKRWRYGKISSNQQLINLNWQGDGLQLLNKLAHSRGLKFAFTGVRQPLPVGVDVKNTTYSEVLNDVRAQIGYRASVKEYSDKILLQYNPPKSQ